jgi:hypothetical protein
MSYRIPPVTHGVFASTVTQTYTGSTTTGTSDGQFVYFDLQIDADSGVSLSGSTGINVSSRGDYLFTVSAILDQTSGTNVAYEMWFLLNGALVTDSNTRIQNATSTNEQVLSVPIVLDLVKGDTVQLRWFCDNANGTIKSTAAVGAVRPRIPSIIVAVIKVSE